MEEEEDVEGGSLDEFLSELKDWAVGGESRESTKLHNEIALAIAERSNRMQLLEEELEELGNHSDHTVWTEVGTILEEFNSDLEAMRRATSARMSFNPGSAPSRDSHFGSLRSGRLQIGAGRVSSGDLKRVMAMKWSASHSNTLSHYLHDVCELLGLPHCIPAPRVQSVVYAESVLAERKSRMSLTPDAPPSSADVSLAQSYQLLLNKMRVSRRLDVNAELEAEVWKSEKAEDNPWRLYIRGLDGFVDPTDAEKKNSLSLKQRAEQLAKENEWKELQIGLSIGNIFGIEDDHTLNIGSMSKSVLNIRSISSAGLEEQRSESPSRLSTRSRLGSSAPAIEDWKPKLSQFKKAAAEESSSEDGDDWRSALREAWNEEIAYMPDMKQSWYKKQMDSLASPMRRQRKLKQAKASKLQKELSEKERTKKINNLRKSLEKLHNQLDGEFTRCGRALRDLRLQEKAHRNNSKEELLTVEASHQPSLVLRYKHVVQMKLICLKVQMEVEDRKSLAIRSQSKRVKLALQHLRSAKEINDSIFSSGLPTLQGLYNVPEIQGLVDRRKTIERELKKIQRDFTRLASVRSMLEDRTAAVADLVEKSVVHTVNNCCVLDEDIQEAFNCLLLDQRYRDGLKILRLREAIAATPIEEVPPHEVVSFIQQLVEETAATYAVAEEDLFKLRMLVVRAVYPVLYNCLFFCKPDHRESDTVFDEKVTWLRKLRPEQLDPVLDKYYDPEEDRPFEMAIEHINCLAFFSNPIDMLLVLFETMQLVEKHASNHTAELSADDLFPIWLYVSIQVNIKDLHAHLSFMENFAFPEHLMTQLGYCLTTFQAAVSHVTSLDKAAFLTHLHMGAAEEERDK